MRFKINTLVQGNYLDVFSRFDRDLFEFLAPPQSAAEIVAFTGSQTGDRVHLRFKRPFAGTWISEIVEHGSTEDEAYFVDEGTSLPFGLKFWRHRHVVRHIASDKSMIVDDIEYQFSNRILTFLFFPAMYLAFLPRKRGYKRYFNQ